MDNQDKNSLKQAAPLGTNETKNVARNVVLIPGIGLVFIATLFIVFGGLNAQNVFKQHKTETTQGKVINVHIIFPANYDRPSPACEFSYGFTVNNLGYVGNSGNISNSSYCDIKSGSAVTVHYNPNDPSDNGLNNSGGVTGMGFFLVGLLFMTLGIYIIRRARNTMGDRATGAQIALIENGLQELGEYWQPHKMTRAEADQVLEDIQTRLNAQNK